MTYLELRQKQTALSARHSSERAEQAARHSAERASLSAQQSAEREELAADYNSQDRGGKPRFVPFEQRKGWDSLAPAQQRFILASPDDYINVEDFTV